MKLYEQYFKRNNISLNLVENCYSAIAICNSDKNQYSILQVTFEKDKESDRNIYFVKTIEPISNSYNDIIHFKTTRRNNIKISDYEEFMYALTKKIKKNNVAASSVIEKRIFLWEIFLRVCDKEVSRYPIKVIDLINQSVNKELPYEIRNEFIDNVLENMEQSLINFWKINFYNKYLSNNSQWLERLINE